MLVVSVGLAISGLPAAAAPEGRNPVDRVVTPDTPTATSTPKPVDLKTFDPNKAKLVERTESADIYAVDASRVAVIHAGPANVKDSQGRWQPIDSRLVPAGADGFRTTTGPLDVSFSATPNSTPLVRIGGDGWSAAFNLEGAAAGKRGEVSGSTILYPNVLDGVDVKYQVAADTIKEIIVLNQPPSDGARFRFP
jgi:hypothetical protein